MIFSVNWDGKRLSHKSHCNTKSSLPDDYERSTIANKWVKQGITYRQIEIVFCIFHTFQGNDGKRNHKVKWSFLMNMPAKHKAACVSIGYPSSNHPSLGISPSLYKTWSYCKQDKTEGNHGGDLQYIGPCKRRLFKSPQTNIIWWKVTFLPCFQISRFLILS